MKLVPFAPQLKMARQGGYAVPAFNVVNMETVQAVSQAAEMEHSPLVIQLYHADLDFAGADYMVSMASTAASHCTVPISISLDHGQSWEQAIKCIESGFTGVMIDLSSSDFYENIRITQNVVEYAHKRNVSVEAELGKITDAAAPLEIRNSGLTDPDAAAEFVEKTGVDALAVSIGTAHGLYSSTPVINFDLVEEILHAVHCPVVVHGGSDTPDEDIVRLCKLGVSKINIGTDLNNAFNRGVLAGFERFGDKAPIRSIMDAGRAEVIRVARQKIRLLRTYAK